MKRRNGYSIIIEAFNGEREDFTKLTIIIFRLSYSLFYRTVLILLIGLIVSLNKKNVFFYH